jgi:hypothetical protein
MRKSGGESALLEAANSGDAEGKVTALITESSS